MNFAEALNLLKAGHRVISKQDKRGYDQQWLSLDEHGGIIYMNEPWHPSPDCLLAYLSDDWIDVEKDCDYHDHNDKTGECYLRDK